MGTIVKRKNKNAEVYTVRVRLKNLPEITATFKELKEAERFIFEKEIWLTKDPLNYSKLGRKYLLKDLIKKFTADVNKATYLAVKLFPSLSLVKNKKSAPTVGSKIKDERIGKFII